MEQTNSFDNYAHYAQEEASRASYKPGPVPVEWEPQLPQVDFLTPQDRRPYIFCLSVS